MPPETCVFHRSIVSYPEPGGGSTNRGGNVKRRLTGLLVIVAVALVAVGVGVSYGGGKATTTLTMWSYDNQDPGLEPVLKQLSKEFEASHPGVKINLVFKDFNSLVGTVPRALASGQRPRRDRGQPGLPDGCAAREGEADHPADEVRQQVRLEQALRAVHLGDVPLDARRQVVRQGAGLGSRADGPEHRRLLQQEEAQAGRPEPERLAARRTPGSRRCSPRCGRSCRRAIR